MTSIDKSSMPVVILCGGKGTRLREETEFKPKPMVTIGGMPILWHIMKGYSHFGFNRFILCLGYKGETIREFFLDYEWMTNDFTMNLGNRMEWITHFKHNLEDWTITFVDTGEESLTARRLQRIEEYIDTDTFMLTYGDGVGDIDFNKLIAHHEKKNTITTLTGLHPVSRFGVIQVDDGFVKEFREKPILEDLINAGFMVVNKKIFNYIDKKQNVMLEDDTLLKLAKEKQLAIYKHEGFWYSMDTYRDYLKLNAMWDKGDTPWKVWE